MRKKRSPKPAVRKASTSKTPQVKSSEMRAARLKRDEPAPAEIAPTEAKSDRLCRLPKPNEISLIDAVEKLYGGTEHVKPAYYTRLVFAAHELLLCEVKKRPFPFGLLEDYLDDKECFDQVMANLESVVRPLSSRWYRELDKGVIAWKTGAGKEWFQKNPISPVGRHKFLYAMEHVRPLNVFRKKRGMGEDVMKLRYQHSKPSGLSHCLSPLLLIRWLAASQEVDLLEEQERLGTRACPDIPERDQLYARYHEVVSDGIRDLVDYKATFEDIVRLCIWKGFPVRDEYLGLVQDAEHTCRRDYTYACAQDVWPLYSRA